ncbi:MAG: glycosyltransferase family 2 protein [Patescibacteria group bacterium]
MISIIIPVYNQADKIIYTLESIRKQSYQDVEVIIVNDGSTDNVQDICARYFKKTESTINYLFLNQENKGAPSARNHGYKESKGEYVFFCDADAVLNIEAMELLLSTLENNPKVSYAYSSFLWGRKIFKLGDFDADKLRKTPYIHTMSLIRRNDYPAVGWDESIKKFQDWDLWLTMLEQGKVGIFVNKVLFKVLPGGTISSWLPSFAYKYLPFLPLVKKYNNALEIIKKKHGLS